MHRLAMFAIAAAGLWVGGPAFAADFKVKGDTRKAPPPTGAVVLFDGTSTEAFKSRNGGGNARWLVQNGELQIVPGMGDILTKATFRDYILHVEFATAVMEDRHGQERSNSGVYNHGLYEIQVLDSFNDSTYEKGMCGAIYQQKAPDINACRPPGQWQTYDIKFRAPRFGPDNKVTENPRVTVYHNSVLIHDNVEITVGPTVASLGGPVTPRGPILLQDHNAPVRYRNIWLKPLNR